VTSDHHHTHNGVGYGTRLFLWYIRLELPLSSRETESSKCSHSSVNCLTRLSISEGMWYDRTRKGILRPVLACELSVLVHSSVNSMPRTYFREVRYNIGTTWCRQDTLVNDSRKPLVVLDEALCEDPMIIH